jgi:hypothetical protein
VVENVYRFLVKASEAISSLEHCDQEIRNVGRQSMHHMSFTMLVSKSLKLLRKTKTKKANVKTDSSKMVLMGKSRAAYTVSSLDEGLRRNISTWVELGKALAKAKTPHTCEEWGEEVNRLMAVMQAGKVVGMDGGYRGVWTIRSCLICRMRQDNIKRLKIGDVPVRKFMSLFPDQKQQVLQMSGGKYMLHRKIADVFADAECSYACIARVHARRTTETF